MRGKKDFGSLQNACAVCFVPAPCKNGTRFFSTSNSRIYRSFFRNQDLNLTIFVMAYDSSTMVGAEASWEFHKEIIEQLYLSEDKTLSVVTKIMSTDYNFPVT